MRTLFTGPLPWMIGAALLLLASAFFWFSGSAIVVDETRGVETAVITNGGGAEQKLYRLWSGFFFTIPQLEGTIEIRCKNGVRKQWGYVTGHFHTKIKVVGKTPCERVIHAD